MNEGGKKSWKIIYFIYSYTCNFISKLLRSQKNGGFLFNCIKIPLIVFCCKSQDCEKENKIFYIAIEKMGETTVDSR